MNDHEREQAINDPEAIEIVIETSEKLDPRDDPPPEFYKVPRRFDLATIFVVTFAYALFWGMMNAVGAEIEITATILTALTLVAVVQMLVPDHYVRVAAIGCGWFSFFAGFLIQVTASQSWRYVDPNDVMGAACSTLIFGGLLGYCAGVVVAGVFLVADRFRRAVRKRFAFLSRDA